MGQEGEQEAVGNSQIVCVPLRYHTYEEVKHAAILAKTEGASLVEVWLDTLPFASRDKRSIKQMAALLGDIELPLICVTKASEEQGSFKGSEKDRIRLLENAMQIGVDYVDVGIHTAPELIEVLNKKIEQIGGMTQLIISYHNFNKTPHLEELKEIVLRAESFGADVIKIATYANSEEDNKTIFEILDFISSKNKNAIGTTMGSHSKAGRIHACEHGSLWTYGSLNEDTKTAMGQLTIKELL